MNKYRVIVARNVDKAAAEFVEADKFSLDAIGNLWFMIENGTKAVYPQGHWFSVQTEKALND